MCGACGGNCIVPSVVCLSAEDVSVCTLLCLGVRVPLLNGSFSVISQSIYALALEFVAF